MNVYRIIKAKLLQFVVWKNTFGSSLLVQKSYATLLSFCALWSIEKSFCDRSVHRVITCLLTKLHSCEFLSRRKYCSLWSNINQRDESWTQHLLGLVPLICLKRHRLQKNTKNAAAPKYSECSDLHCTDFWLKYAQTRVTVWTRVKCWPCSDQVKHGGGGALLSDQFNTQTHRVSAKSLTWNTKAVHSSVAADVSFSLFFIRSFKHLVLLVSTCVAVFQFLPLSPSLSLVCSSRKYAGWRGETSPADTVLRIQVIIKPKRVSKKQVPEWKKKHFVTYTMWILATWPHGIDGTPLWRTFCTSCHAF